MISRHRPLITNRISFTRNAIAPPPKITPRTHFVLAPKGSQGKKKTLPSRQLTPSVNSDSDHADHADPNDDGESELTDLSECSDSEQQGFAVSAKKIPKPSGEPGRPKSGGYSIDEVLLSWGKEELGKVTTLTKKMADLKLDRTKSYSKQDCRKINSLCETVARNHPIVDKYEEHWPVRAILKLHLKAASENFRREGKQQGTSKTKTTARA